MLLMIKDFTDEREINSEKITVQKDMCFHQSCLILQVEKKCHASEMYVRTIRSKMII